MDEIQTTNRYVNNINSVIHKHILIDMNTTMCKTLGEAKQLNNYCLISIIHN